MVCGMQRLRTCRIMVKGKARLQAAASVEEGEEGGGWLADWLGLQIMHVVSIILMPVFCGERDTQPRLYAQLVIAGR